MLCFSLWYLYHHPGDSHHQHRPENVNVEPEEVDEAHKGPHILRSKVEKVIK
jgi:hypothetical protein